jgi:hypothetical protein
VGHSSGRPSLGQAVDLVRQRIGDEESRQKVPDAAHRQLWGYLTDPVDPFAPFLAQIEMAAGRRPGDHRIDEARLLDQRTIGPFDGLFIAPGLQVRDGEGKLDQGDRTCRPPSADRATRRSGSWKPRSNAGRAGRHVTRHRSESRGLPTDSYKNQSY